MVIILINLFVWIGSYQLLRCENSCVLIKGGLFCVCFPTNLITRIEPRHEKTCLRDVRDLRPVRPACSTTETS